MDREVGKLVEAFRGELEGCHRFLDETGCPRSVNGRALTLKDRIAVLVATDREYVGRVNSLLAEIGALRGIADDYAEFGRVVVQDKALPPLAQRLHDILASLSPR